MTKKRYNQIPKEKLINGRWYLGRGRNSNVGFWNGEHFLTICKKFNQWVVKFEGYFEEESGCFQPFILIDEGEIIPFGKSGWDAHYGKELIQKK